jgi:cephalosporin-C deacetylase
VSEHYGPYPPEDFEEFWTGTVQEALDVPLDYHRSFSNDFDLPGFVVETIDFRSVQDRWVSGWFAYPEGARRVPGFVWVPPYGRESLLPNAYGTRDGMASLSFNFHGHPAFHQEKYTPARGYFSEGAANPETWIFRRMFQDAYNAVRVLQAQLEVDEDNVSAMGMSQGAGISIWLGAWCNLVKRVCADMPFLGGINITLQKDIYRYPLKELVDYMDSIPLGRERVLSSIAYFDTINQASKCTVPTHVSMGLKDPACKPATVQAIYEALPGQKQLEIIDWGHDWHPSMVDNNRNWLLRKD